MALNPSNISNLEQLAFKGLINSGRRGIDSCSSLVRYYDGGW